MGKNKNRSRPFTNNKPTTSAPQKTNKVKVDASVLTDRIEEYMESHDKTTLSQESEDIVPLITHLRKTFVSDYKSIPFLDFKEICTGAVEKMLYDDSDESMDSSDSETSEEAKKQMGENLTKLKEAMKTNKNSINQQLQNVYKEQTTTAPPTAPTATIKASETKPTAPTTSTKEQDLKRKRHGQDGEEVKPSTATTTVENKVTPNAPPQKKTKSSTPSDPNAPRSKTKITIETPTVRFCDLGGIDHILQDIREMIEHPILHPEVYATLGVEPPRGVLLYGPPGSGKVCLVFS